MLVLGSIRGDSIGLVLSQAPNRLCRKEKHLTYSEVKSSIILLGGSCECPPKRLTCDAVPGCSATIAFDGFDIYRNLANWLRLMKENVERLWKQSLFHILYHIGTVVMSMIDICIEKFNILLTTEYEFTLGRKNRAVKLLLKFSKEDWFHLMGFQYLKDLPHLKRSRNKIFDDIAENRISANTIEESVFYGEIRERVQMLSYLEDILDDNDTIFRYSATVNAFSKIQAKFLLDHRFEDQRIFVFLSQHSDGDYFCRSFFPMSNIDFAKNQQKWTLLRKVKRDTARKAEIELYRNPHYKEISGQITGTIQ